MQILIHKNGNQLGPFPEPQVAEMLKSGQVAGTDLAWSDGMETWKPLSSFAQFQICAGGPPPIPGQPPVLPSQRRTEPLSIWSLVLGILSLVACGFFAGIPAVICGHVGMSRIKRDPSLDGKEFAVAGLITGYISVLVFPFIVAVLTALALPAFVTAKDKAKDVQMLNNMRSIHLAMMQAQLEGKSSEKFRSKEDVKKLLVEHGFLKAGDFDRLQFERISVGNVSADDPPDTVQLQAKSENGRSTIVVLKDGSGHIVQSWQPPFGPPPRTPAFLMNSTRSSGR